jgi:hypothetical protein
MLRTSGLRRFRAVAQAWIMLYGPFQKNCNVGQVANLPKQRQIGNLPYVPVSPYYWNGP